MNLSIMVTFYPLEAKMYDVYPTIYYSHALRLNAFLTVRIFTIKKTKYNNLRLIFSFLIRFDFCIFRTSTNQQKSVTNYRCPSEKTKKAFTGIQIAHFETSQVPESVQLLHLQHWNLNRNGWMFNQRLASNLQFILTFVALIKSTIV